MSPLVTLLVLGLLLVVVVALLIWAIASASWHLPRKGERQRRPPPAEQPAEEPPPAAPLRVERASNDDLRGARAVRPAPPRSDTEDAFERFLRSGRDDDR